MDQAAQRRIDEGNDIDLKWLRSFVVVAEEANFTRAAERVHVSQSGVSAQVRQLERDLGTALIDRSGRVATLTAAGVAALPHARATLAAAAAARQAVDDVTGLLSGQIVVGMVTACTVAPLFDALAAFHLAHPGVEIALVEGNSGWLVEQVRTGGADVALIGRPAPRPRDSTRSPSSARAWWPRTPRPSARRAGGRHPGRGHQVPDHQPAPGDRGARGVRSGLRRPGAAAGHRVPGQRAGRGRRPGQPGLGVAILTETMAAAFSGQLTAVAIKDSVTPALLALVWTRAESPAVRELLVHSRQAFAPQLPR